MKCQNSHSVLWSQTAYSKTGYNKWSLLYFKGIYMCVYIYLHNSKTLENILLWVVMFSMCFPHFFKTSTPIKNKAIKNFHSVLL